MFNRHLYWMTPIAIICSVNTCFATQYLSIDQAQKLCFPKATNWVTTTYHLSQEQIQAIENESGISVRFPEQKVWAAYRNKEFLGWFILDQVVGKHELIQWAAAIDKNGSIQNLEILNYKETFGYEVKQKKWRSQFIGKTVKDPLKLDQDIENISGATLSSRHITEGVKRLLAFYETILKGS